MHPQRPLPQAMPTFSLGQHLRDMAMGLGRGKNFLGGNFAYGFIHGHGMLFLGYMKLYKVFLLLWILRNGTAEDHCTTQTACNDAVLPLGERDVEGAGPERTPPVTGRQSRGSFMFRRHVLSSQVGWKNQKRLLFLTETVGSEVK
ncbi:hypothetical protein Q8A73_007933 [Channa argus]|nr:hypothetical protein Q8A73_007933 [Channa argus]